MTLLSGFLKRLAEARAADAAELEQTQLRLINGAVLVSYFVIAFLWDGVLDAGERSVLWLGAGYYALSLAVFGWCVFRPGVNAMRRWAGSLVDAGSSTVIMVRGEETATVIYGLYLWVVIGNGFRYGRRQMHGVQILSIVSFSLVLLLSEYWRRNLTLGIGLLLALVVVPLYVSKLLARLEEARAQAVTANMTKTKFLAAASHDLRQPMQALSMYTSLLQSGGDAAAQQRVLRGIELSVTTLERLFDSLLDVSKIESGVVKPCLAAIPLMPLIDQVVEAERPLAAHKGLELRAVRTSAWIESDPALLERMLKNLVTNAIRYTERGRIVVGCRRCGSHCIRLEVLDTGIGIAAEEQQRIFKEYYQVNGASGQGLGLGLPIVKSLGELLGHAVAVRSAPGHGSVFSIELPRSAPLALPQAEPQQPAAGGACVVLVDDDAEIRRSMQLLLGSWGYEIVAGATVGDVERALAARRLQPDALIVDYRLADAMTGIQVIERLRASFGADLPALVMTGNANIVAVRAHAPGIPIAVKPVPPGRLRAFLSVTTASAT